MSDVIHLLPDSVANQIAAGEVVQRPASVIKELVENSIDAGATHVDVLVVDAGRESIQVIDNGKGMSETDARLAFERHATSKITKADDLFTLHTMGFRGEALPSIVAVSQVTLRTRMADQEVGTCLYLEGSRVVSQEVVACPVGSNFLVQNLFFNVPARRKFLRTNQTEFKNILQEYERMALVNPSVGFTLSNNGTMVSSLQGGSVLQRIVGIFGKRIGAQLLNVEVDTTLCRLTGFVGKPESSRKKDLRQYFFVNGRYMRHPYFHKAVQSAFSGLIPESEQVSYFLYFDIDPASIDVNISPTKTEIKFQNEQAIWPIVVAAIKEALGKYNAVPVIEFDTEGLPVDIPVYNPAAANSPVKAPEVSIDPSFNPFDATPAYSRTPSVGPFAAPSLKTAKGGADNDFSFSTESSSSGAQSVDGAQSTSSAQSVNGPQSQTGARSVSGAGRGGASAVSGQYDAVVPDFLLSPETPDFATQAAASSAQAMMASSAAGMTLPEHSASISPTKDGGLDGSLYSEESLRDMEKSSEHFQFRGQYIMTSIRSGLLIVDQHRAHVRILYNRYRQQMEGQATPSQGMLFPEIIQLPMSDAAIMDGMMDNLRQLGFDMTSLGGGSFSLQGVPVGIDGLNPVTVVTDMVASMRETGRMPQGDEMQHRVALSLARNAAIPAGQVLSAPEMSHLLDDLFATDNPNYAPDGKTVLAILPCENIEKMFKT